MTVHVATANVNSLKPGRASIRDVSALAGRAQLLEFQFDRAHLDCIGVQEGRIPTDQRLSGSVYEMLISGCDAAGCYGSQIWLRRSPDMIIQSWVAHNPRLIEAVCIYTKVKQVVRYISAHAPHELDQGPVKDRFWLNLYSVCKSALCSGHVLILLIDANARVGEHTCDAIGAYEVEAENDNGSRFRTVHLAFQFQYYASH
eukprot:1438402-Karenia_brevis.AAC.1